MSDSSTPRKGKEPSLMDFSRSFDSKTAEQIAESVEEIRREDVEFEKEKMRRNR